MTGIEVYTKFIPYCRDFDAKLRNANMLALYAITLQVQSIKYWLKSKQSISAIDDYHQKTHELFEC